MRFCGYEECPHYSKATKYERACYYREPMCWKDGLICLLRRSTCYFTRSAKGGEVYVTRIERTIVNQPFPKTKGG